MTTPTSRPSVEELRKALSEYGITRESIGLRTAGLEPMREKALGLRQKLEAALDELAALRSDLQRKTRALELTRDILEGRDPPGVNNQGAFADTIWAGPAETLLDAVDAALTPSTEEGKT